MDFFSREKWAERYNKCCFVSRKNKRIQNTKQYKTQNKTKQAQIMRRFIIIIAIKHLFEL